MRRKEATDSVICGPPDGEAKNEKMRKWANEKMRK
jgi:hypothetical protein